MGAAVSVRLGAPVEEAAARYLAQTGWNRTSLINTALREWLRAQSHPRIRFVATPTGTRVAALVDGPEVWTVAESWNQHDPSERTVENVVAATGLTRREVDCALAYYAEFRDEIDIQIDRINRAQEQARLAWDRRKALYG
ncbi:MAG: hypothetical protein FWD74_09960 [Actinomycetia bacterium]|nr:hypothetical protein [Actinomycetes bacterium]